jgi:Pyruvate/2-oxoacid:ferredoxin oxidoreductase delta subunit
MCEFCLKHGEGEKWYLQAKNYSDDLLSDVRRRRFVAEFADLEKTQKSLARSARGLERLSRAPKLIRDLMGRIITRKMKKTHFGQVVPIEEVEKIFSFTNSIVRVACVCRKALLGQEKRYCYGISLSPNGGLLGEFFRGLGKSSAEGPDAKRFEVLTKQEALAAFRAHEREGLCHTVWTFHTPFIGGICNCDRADCLALRSTVSHSVPVLFRAEYVAEVSAPDCVGCRQCSRLCQFGAIAYSAANQKAVIDRKWCYGCGICRAACKKDAIRLKARAQVPAVADLW